MRWICSDLGIRNTRSRFTVPTPMWRTSTTALSKGIFAELVTALVFDADYVYHQAAKAGVRQSIDAPREYDEVNVDGTLNFLAATQTPTSSAWLWSPCPRSSYSRISPPRTKFTKNPTGSINCTSFCKLSGCLGSHDLVYSGYCFKTLRENSHSWE